MRRRGLTLVELLAGVAVGSVVGLGVLHATLALWRAQSFSVAMPAVQDDAKKIVLTLAADLRRATLCAPTDAGCTLDAAVEGATATGVTVYRRNANGTLAKLAYAVSSGAFRLNGVPVVPDAALTLTFYGGTTYHSSTLSPFVPTDATAKTLTAVGLSATVSRDGVTGTYATFVRLRNSPKKTTPGD